MKKILLIAMCIFVLAIAALLTAFAWAIREAAREEDARNRQQMLDDPACWKDVHDISGLIEED